MDDINIAVNSAAKSELTAADGYSVASCFRTPLQRLDVAQLPSYWNYDESTGNSSGITDQGAFYTFEEFIGNPSPVLSPRQHGRERENSAKLANISSVLTNEFLNLESQPSHKIVRRASHKQKPLEKKDNNISFKTIRDQAVNADVQFGSKYCAGLSPECRDENTAHETQMEANVPCTLLRQAFCPTVSNNIYGVQRNADSGSMYAYYSSDNSEQCQTTQTGCTPQPKFSFQRAFSDPIDDNMVGTSTDSSGSHPVDPTASTMTDDRKETAVSSKKNNASKSRARRRHYCESLTGTLFSKMMHCFRATANIVNVRRHRQYAVNSTGPDQPTTLAVADQPGKYSWDRERSIDVNNCDIHERKDELIVRTHEQTTGEQIIIENCTNCIIVVLNSSASVTIDDCRECLIVLGPCKGSIFMRDCSFCSLYVICQQFRSRDCHNVNIRLFCATAPTIEDSNLEIGPLTMCYNRLEKHMAEAELSPLVNNWFRVHNFTPESSKFTFVEMNTYQIQEDEENLCAGCQLNDRFSQEFLMVPQINELNLTFRPSASFFFRIPRDNDEAVLKGDEEKVLILVKSFDKRINIKSPEELYHDVRRLLKKLLAANENRDGKNSICSLFGLYDVDLKAGEYENLFHLKPDKTPAGKLLAIELAGRVPIIREFCTSTLTAIGDPPSMQIIDVEKTQFSIQQLSRFSESQNHV